MSDFENLFIMFHYGYKFFNKLLYFSKYGEGAPIADNKKIYEEYDKLANEFLDETEDLEVVIGIMDCSEPKRVGCDKYMKTGYMFPVISLFSRHFEDPKGIFYMEQKTKDKMLSWLSDKLIIERDFTGPKGGVYFEKNGVVELNSADYQ